MAVLAVVGGLAEAAGWLMVTLRRTSLWVVLTPLLAAMGIAALATGEPQLAGRVSAPIAAAAGLGSAVVLYLATRAFVRVVGGWRAFRAQSADLYRHRGSLSVPQAAVLSAVLAAGEELFWRGLVQPRSSAGLDSRALGAVLAYGAFVLANLPSLNLAVVAGAVVGGAVWTSLAWWSGGVLASAISHVAWTALMVVRPPVPVGSGSAA
jgi:membrane protease YdiL (CAAX protease family)